jgi:hypothetical protein
VGKTYSALTTTGQQAKTTNESLLVLLADASFAEEPSGNTNQKESDNGGSILLEIAKNFHGPFVASFAWLLLFAAATSSPRRSIVVVVVRAIAAGIIGRQRVDHGVMAAVERTRRIAIRTKLRTQEKQAFAASSAGWPSLPDLRWTRKERGDGRDETRRGQRTKGGGRL